MTIDLSFKNCDTDTALIIINETPEDFKIDDIFSDISEGVEVEKKNQSVFDLKDVKLIITSNRVIQGSGSSFRARKFEIEFASHYDDKHSPLDEFKHRFFDDWDESEWRLFDNFMLNCVQLFLNNGLIEYERKNVKLRSSLESMPEDLINYFETLEFDERYLKRNCCNEYKFISRESITQKQFTINLRAYCDSKGLSLQEFPGGGGAERSFIIAPNKSKSRLKL